MVFLCVVGANETFPPRFNKLPQSKKKISMEIQRKAFAEKYMISIHLQLAVADKVHNVIAYKHHI